jgi:hypothetical protein
MFHRYVASVSYGCCKSRSGCCICCNGCIRMLQASLPNVSSVFSDVCCKCVYLDVVCISHRCCKCFIWMLRMFTMVSSVFQVFFQVFQTHVSSVSSVFRRMLQVLRLDVSKVDRVLHLPPRLLLHRLSVSSFSRRRLGTRYDTAAGTHRGFFRTRGVGRHPPPPILDAGDVRAARAPCGVRETKCRRDRPFGHSDANPAE